MTLSPEQLAPLRSFPFFSSLSPDDLSLAAQSFESRSFLPGKDLFREGEKGRNLYLILSGQASIWKRGKNGPAKVRTLGTGSFVGEEILLGKTRRAATARVEEELSVLRAGGRELHLLKRNLPDLYASLQSCARGSLFAQPKRFPWLQAGETVYLATRKSGALLVPGLILPIGLTIASAAGIFLIAHSGWPLFFHLVPVSLGLGALILAAWNTVDWSNDLYFVTNRRVVVIQRVPLIYDDRREVPMHSIQSVFFSTTITGRLFGFGDVVVRTYTRPAILHNVPRPQRVARLVEEIWKRERERSTTDSRTEIEETLRSRLRRADLPAAEQDSAAGTDSPPDDTVRDTFFRPLQTRIETGAVVTYRKHLFFLIRNIFLPALLTTTGVNLAAFSIVGIFPIDRFWGTAIGTLTLFSGILWAAYEYFDWANDLFQVTPEQILAIHRKPLGDEERRAASLENILSLEYDRPTLLARLLNFGTVRATVGQTSFTFEQVKDPVGIQEDIFRRMDQRRQLREIRERQDRRDEIASWIETYHQMAESPEAADGIDEGWESNDDIA